MTELVHAPTPAVETTAVVRSLPEHDELRRLRQIRALRVLLRRAAELKRGEA